LQGVHGVSLGGVILIHGLVHHLAHAGQELIVGREDPNGQSQLKTEQNEHADGVLKRWVNPISLPDRMVRGSK